MYIYTRGRGHREISIIGKKGYSSNRLYSKQPYILLVYKSYTNEGLKF